MRNRVVVFVFFLLQDKDDACYPWKDERGGEELHDELLQETVPTTLCMKKDMNSGTEYLSPLTFTW